MNRDHIRYALIALALALMAINASLALGLHNEPNLQIGEHIDQLEQTNQPTTLETLNND